MVGSGEVIRDDGYVLTNAHVVSAAANGGKVTVLFADGRSAAATIRGRDVPTDLAVLKLDTTADLHVIALGSSDKVQIGEPVVALGAPLGLANTLTAGIVSSLDRTVQVEVEAGKTATLLSAIQTDAAINPGNSGGALVNCEGQLIGVPTANASTPNPNGGGSGGSIGLGFAIPVDLATAVADQLIASGAVTHSYLGLSVAPVLTTNPDKSQQVSGLRVTAVDPAGPSAKAGLLAGDVITQIDGAPATDANQLAEITLKKKPGEQVSLTYQRNGKATQATVTLAAPPPT
jgi:putative serine protease PepD